MEQKTALSSEAPWELRIGDLRVFYEVAADEPDVVRILAVGREEGNRLFIAEQEVNFNEND
jgi:mRNA-degrading endonuclease RelE of RelBE toxin-antitoxin system